uniref:Protein kinase domain-containing protein n=1 Tax=Haptolina ericina TaxID=156174 RepID=A0A7S3B5S7_9EUKA
MGVDMWQMGLLVFEMLFGRHPFRRETEIETLAAILRGDFAMPVTAAVSQQARDLVRGLLMIDPLYRLSASDCLRHQWFSSQLAGGAHRVGRGVFPRVTLRVRAQGEAAE